MPFPNISVVNGSSILVVNDVPDQLGWMSVLLDKAGYFVHTAGDADSAFDLAKRVRPTLIISDVSMPGKDGIELCRLIRSDSLLKAIPVLLVSALRKDSVSMVEGLRAGANDFIESPCEPALMLAKIEQLIKYRLAEEALRREKEYFAHIISAAPFIFVGIKPDGTTTFVNPAIQQITGYEPDELVGKNWWHAFYPGEEYRQVEQLFKAFEQGEVVSHEMTLTTKTGEKRCVSWNSVNRFNEQGEIIEVIGIGSDVTDRQRAEEALRQSERDYRELFDQAHDAILILAPEDETVLDVNQRACEIYGFSREEFIGLSLESISLNVEAGKERIRQTLNVGSYFNFETVQFRKDGSQMALDINASLVSYKGRRAILSINRDITDRKRAEIALREADQRALQEYERLLDRIAGLGQTLGTARNLITVYRALLDFAIVSTDCRGIFISLYDPKLEVRQAAFAWSEGEEVDVSELPPMPMNESPNSRAVRTGEVIITDDFQAATAGLPVTLIGMEHDPSLPQSSLVVPMAVMGRVIGAVEVQSTRLTAFNQSHATAMRMAANLAAVAIENVRLLERERMQEENLRQAQKMEAIGHLAGGVAHDFNNLLTAITGYADLALRRIDPTNQREAILHRQIEEVKVAGERAANLTRQLLAFSRKQILQPKVINLNDTIANISKMLRRLIGEDVDLVLQLDSSLGLAKVDPTQVEQIIMNLAVNARDAMPKGGTLVIETKNVLMDERGTNYLPSAQSVPHVRLAISDTGIGVDREALNHIFEPFFTTKGVGKGTGLGLSTVYGIVKQSGGHITVYSEVGYGTTFKIYLPRVDQPVEQIDERIDEATPRGGETILLVEDEEIVRKLTTAILKEHGYKVIDAENGMKALEILGQTREEIDLLITDVIMPAMSGRELADQAKSLRPNMNLLFISGYTDDAIVHHGVLDEGTPFLEKPFSPDTLARKVREILDKGR